DPGNPAAWYNLAVVQAWLGMNREAVNSLNRYIELEPADDQAAAAGALAEVLRLGEGMEDDADYVEHSVVYQIRDPRPFVAFLNEGERERRLVVVEVRQEEHWLMALVLDRVTGLTEESTRSQLPRLGAYLLMMGDVVRLWHTDGEALDRAVQQFQERAGPGLSEGRRGRSPASFADVLAEILFVPVGIAQVEEAQ